MNAEQLIALVGSLGFPIAITIYVLVAMNRSMKELATAITDLRATLRECLPGDRGRRS